MARRVVFSLLVAVALGALQYPAAAKWVENLLHHLTDTGYVAQVSVLPAEVVDQRLTAARDYNTRLADGLQPVTNTAVDTEYANILAFPGTSEMGMIHIPVIGVELPFYPGTSDEVLQIGAGHLYGTSLPVGGQTSHSVITAHSGMLGAELFNRIHQLVIDDEIDLLVGDQTATYRVIDIAVVEPGEVDRLRIEPGRDLLTLLTCTPIHVNTHRLLVHAERAAPTAGRPTAQLIGFWDVPGVPWWALIWCGGVAGSVLLARAVTRRQATSVPTATGQRVSERGNP